MSRSVAALLVALGVGGCDACPQTRPSAFASCAGPSCGASLLVRTSGAPDVATFLTCDGFPRSDDLGPDGCGSLLAPGSSWGGGGDADLVATTAPTIYGYFYRLEVEARGGGRARLCRLFVTDVHGEACEPAAECAVEGEVVLTAGGGGTVSGTFAGGATIDAAF